MLRRTFLQTAAASIGSWLLPWRLFANTRSNPRFHFVATDSLDSWDVADPVSWCLAHRHEPLLERAAEGLAKLTEHDGERIVRLVVRRCRLNLVELLPDQVVVHYWGQQGQADLRPFFKQRGLARPDVTVVIHDRKRENVTRLTGEDFLYGSKLDDDFPLDRFLSKFANRYVDEPDDWTAAPKTRSGFAWEGVEIDRIPWAALKSAWRRSTPEVCQNCDTPTLLVNFGYPQVSMLNRAARFICVCPTCRRSFLDQTAKQTNDWLIANLDEHLQPQFIVIWGRRRRRTNDA